HQIRQITSPVTFLTYTYFQMRAEAKAYSGLHNCHNPALQCEGVLLPSDFSTDLKVSCRLCTTVHCSVCFLPDHPDLSCQEASRIQRKRAKTNSVEYQRRKQRRARLRGGIKAIIPTIITQTLMTVHPAAKRCPGCFNWIFKNGGCHHMNCQHCRINFCWDCRSPYGGRPHCLLNGILFPVALPIAVATCAVYSASAILPVSLYLVGHRIKKAIQGRPYSFPGQVVGDACLMNYHIGNYIAPFTYHQMFN
ncbi:MAG: IBR domain-containing protein, partial [archaeon]|nr:IBR domain-containing protein [archaeon]